jgi:hypothetical protein
MCRNDEAIVDYLDDEAAKLFVDMTHEEYRKHFGESFGSTITGTFFDEPTLYRAKGRSWTPDFNRKFKQRYGFSPVLYYPALWYNIGKETQEARNCLFGFRSDLYAEGYIKTVSDWSSKYGLRATGHQDNEEIVNAVGTSGDLMKCFKYLDIPGIDKIGGNRPTENFYKIISSSAHNGDHSLVMSETYGAMGNISWDIIYGIASDQYVKGINLLIPHAVWYNPENVTFKPELSSRNPLYADELPKFTTYLARLNAVMQNDARWSGDIAVLYPIETMQSGHYFDGPLGHYSGGVKIPGLDYVDVGVNLFDSLAYDFAFLHPEVLDGKCSVKNNRLFLNNKVQYNEFSMLILPGCKTVSLSNLTKAYNFAKAGGTVVFTTCLPEKATKQTDDEKVKKIIAKMFPSQAKITSYGKLSTTKKGKVLFVNNPASSNLQAAIDDSQTVAGLRFTGRDRVKNVHKILSGKNIWFLANPENRTKNVEFEISGQYNLQLWNPHTGEIAGLPDVSHANGYTGVKLEIKSFQSLFLIEN